MLGSSAHVGSRALPVAEGGPAKLGTGRATGPVSSWEPQSLGALKGTHLET